MLLNLVPKFDFAWIVSCSWSNHTILLLMFVAEKVLLLLVISLTVNDCENYPDCRKWFAVCVAGKRLFHPGVIVIGCSTLALRERHCLLNNRQLDYLSKDQHQRKHQHPWCWLVVRGIHQRSRWILLTKASVRVGIVPMITTTKFLHIHPHSCWIWCALY